MGDSSDGDSASLFNTIITDMKTMMPMWEDFLVKASKFYSAVKSSAYTADAFLESFQKLADATSNSKGSTRDIGVSFTKLVMRHKSIENKLRTYIGVLTDSFIGPLQEKLEEWKKTASQLEKDHSKDFKRSKSETKKCLAEVVKLRKKVVKKGRHEYSGQYKEAWKVANINIAAMEDQERLYLRKLMVEERSRAIFFFNCYRPVVEQELVLMGEIENLQTILEDTVKQCVSPSNLPLIAEDSISNYKAQERAALPKTEKSSPPPSPTLESARERAFTSIPKGNQNLHRSNTIAGPPTSGYSTLRKKGSGGPAPKPIGIPNPAKSPSRSISSTDVPYDDARDSLNSSSGNVSNFSSMSSLSTASGDQLASDGNQGNQVTPTFGDDMREQVAYYTQHDAKAMMLGSNGMQNMTTPTQATRTSWSSLETSDSSGIGSHISLNSQGRQQHGYDKSNGYHSDGQYENEGYPEYDFEEDMNAQMANLNSGTVQIPHPVPQQQPQQQPQQPFRRNTDVTSSLRGTRASGAPFRRSNSLTEGEGLAPTNDYRMTMPRRPSNTVYAKHPPSGAKPTAFQIFAGAQTPAQLRSRLSPTGSPVKAVHPPAPTRKVSSPPNLMSSGKPPLFPPGVYPSGSVTTAGNNVNYSSNNSSGVYATVSTSGVNNASNAAVSDYATRNVAMQNYQAANSSYADINKRRSQGSDDYATRNAAMQNYPPSSPEYAVPIIQPQSKSPDLFPPPPASLDIQQQQAYQGNLQQQQQPVSHYQATSQYQQQAVGQAVQPTSEQYKGQYAQSQYGHGHYAQGQYAQSQAQPSQYMGQQQQQHYQRQQQQQNHQAQQQQQQQQQNQHAIQQQQQPYQPQQEYSPSKQYQQSQYGYPQQYPYAGQMQGRRNSHSADDDMPRANPGSFLDELQQKRTLVRSRTMSTSSNRSSSFGN